MKNQYKWLTFSSTCNLITNENIESACLKFYDEVLRNLNTDQYILIIFRIKTRSNLYRNISTFQTISKLDIKDFTNTCLCILCFMCSNNGQQFVTFQELARCLVGEEERATPNVVVNETLLSLFLTKIFYGI